MPLFTASAFRQTRRLFGLTLLLLIAFAIGQRPAAFAAPGAISFTKTTLLGEALTNPTSLQFGPDGRLYVSQQDGYIYAYTIQRALTSEYSVIATEQIDLIRTGTPNHNDDGTPNATQTRQITGILVTGTPSDPILYVSSSDWRISVGVDSGLDTNSGVISRLKFNDTTQEWEKVDLVRGLPRSEENHSTNGMVIDPTTNTMYVMSGGHTNKGAPGANLSNIPEYALAAALLSVDLDAIDALPVLTDPNGVDYIYDIPTLDDPTRGTPGQPDPNDPFGGNNGLNQAIIVPGGPVQVYSPGYRNAYDVVLTHNNRLYTFDNGPNTNWGGVPISEGPAGNCTAERNENTSTGYGDGLHYISGPGYYGGHPNPFRANPSNTGIFTYEKQGGNWVQTGYYPFTSTWTPVPFAMANPVECDYRIPGVEDGALAVINDSTNGLTEYTSQTNFGGEMYGNLLAAAFNGNIYRFVLNAAGTQVTQQQTLFSGFGATPLDVWVQPDGQIFAGTVWAATYGASNITIFEPDDFSGCTGVDSPIDEDSDGYTNADEIDNGTNPCSNASTPPDNDNDFVSDLNDADDDNDIVLDINDAFALDASNGTNTSLPRTFSFFNNDPATGLFGLGLTGLMTNGTTDYLDQFDPNFLAAGGTAGLLTVEQTTSGDPYGSTNSQDYAFQLGIDADLNTPPFTIHTRLIPPFFNNQMPTTLQSQGFYFGTGNQDNYIKLVLYANNGVSGFEILKEVNGIADSSITIQPGGLPGTGDIDIAFLINPAAATAQPRYSLNRGVTWVNIGSPITIPASWLADNATDGKGLAVGIIATAGSSPAFAATWDFLDIQFAESDAAAFASVTLNGSLNASTYTNNSFQITNNSASGQQITQIQYDLSTAILPDMVFDPAGTAGDTVAKPFQVNTAGNAGYTTHQLTQPIGIGGYQGLTVNFTGFDPGETFGFSIDVDPTSIAGVGAPGPGDTGSVSGLELVGSRVTITFSDGTVLTGYLYRQPSSNGGSQLTLVQDLPTAPTIELVGVPNPPTTLATAAQTVRVSGPVGASVKLLRVEGALYTSGVPGGGYDLDPFEANTALVIQEYTATIGGGGTVNIPVTLTRANGDAGLNHFIAVLTNGAQTGATSNRIVVEYDPTILETRTLQASPTALTFSPLTVNATSAPQAITLTNTGSAALTITGITLTGSDASQFGTSGPLPTGTLNPGANATVNVVFDPETPGGKQATLQITHTGSNPTLNLTVTGFAQPQNAVVLYRVNAGGPSLAAADGSIPNWSADTSASPSPYVNSSQTNNTSTFTDTITRHYSVAPSAPTALFQSERWDQSSNPPMQWSFPVQAGRPLMVRLYFAETYLTDANYGTLGPRKFDVTIDGVLVENDLDIYALVSDDTGLMRSYTLTSDGVVNINLSHVAENPLINGIEILALDGLTSNANALVAILPGKGLNDSTFDNGSFVITNNSSGGVQITSVKIDLSTALMPDVVFDPIGKGGDLGGKCLTPNSSTSLVGLTTLLGGADPCVAPYSQPHNGVDDNEGWDAITLTFNNFDPGETFVFAADIDPIALKGEPGSPTAGKVTGVETIGATITVTFSDGSTIITETYRDAARSLGGGQAVVTGTPPAAPTLQVLGGITSPSVVSSPNQTIRVSGPVGAEVALFILDTHLFLQGIPNCGYDIDPFEPNNAIAMTEFTNQVIGAAGYVDIPVTLLQTAGYPPGGLNYIVAALEHNIPGGWYGLVSDPVVLSLYHNQGPQIVTPSTQTHAEGASPSLAINACDRPENTLSYSATNLPGGLSINPATGVISGTISQTAAVNSPYNVQVTVADNHPTHPASSVVNVTWNVTVVNVAPVLGPLPNRTTPNGTNITALNFFATATDADLNPLTFSATGLPTGITLNASTGQFIGTIATGGDGNFTVTVTVSDGQSPALTDSDTFTWTVSAANVAPELAAIADRADVDGDDITALNVFALATDANLDTLTYSATVLPPGITLNPVTGQFTGVLAVGGSGMYSVTVTVSDNRSPALTDSDTFTWTVAELVTIYKVYLPIILSAAP